MWLKRKSYPCQIVTKGASGIIRDIVYYHDSITSGYSHFGSNRRLCTDFASLSYFHRFCFLIFELSLFIKM